MVYIRQVGVERDFEMLPLLLLLLLTGVKFKRSGARSKVVRSNQY